MAPMPIAPSLAAPKLPEPLGPSKPVEPAAVSLDRLADIVLRDALNVVRMVRIYGKDYTNPVAATWRNEERYAISVAVEVLVGGPLGATITVEGFVIPADMPGARTGYVALDPNEAISIVFSHAAVVARLHIKTPRAPLGR